MAFAVVHSRALRGLEAPAVTVEVHLANGLPSFTLVGLADTEVKEARERVRAALQTSGLEFPHNKRVTVSLAPADLPKESGRFDLPIALGILAAAGQIDAARLAAPTSSPASSRSASELRPVHGALAMGLAMRSAGDARTLAHAGPAARQRRRERLRSAASTVRGAAHLLDVVRALLPGEAADASALRDAVPLRRGAGCGAARPARRQGQAVAKRALEIAAAGEASLLMVGPPGRAGRCWRSAWPDCCPNSRTTKRSSRRRSLSIADAFVARRWERAHLRAPHHRRRRPWSVAARRRGRARRHSPAMACSFLDELPEFPRAALEAFASRWKRGGSSSRAPPTRPSSRRASSSSRR